MLHYEYQLKVPLFQPHQPHDYIPPSYSHDFLLDYSVSSYTHPFNQMSFEGMSDPLLHPLRINAYLKTRDAVGGNMVFDDAPFLLAFLRENDKSEKLVVIASCEFEHDMVVVSKDIFVEDEYLLEEISLQEPCVDECVEATPSYM